MFVIIFNFVHAKKTKEWLVKEIEKDILVLIIMGEIMLLIREKEVGQEVMIMGKLLLKSWGT